MDSRVEHRVEHGFGPVWNAESRLLILGSMPSPKSREASFYYMHPRNRFWPVMEAVFADLPGSGTIRYAASDCLRLAGSSVQPSMNPPASGGLVDGPSASPVNRTSIAPPINPPDYSTDAPIVQQINPPDDMPTDTLIGAQAGIVPNAAVADIRRLDIQQSEIGRDTVGDTPESRRAFALRHHVALWDVIASCDITGASDASIHNAVPNDLTPILRGAPIVHVFTTGAKAAQLYRKLIEPQLAAAGITLPMTPLPSTSPANAAMRLPDLVAVYRAAFEDALMHQCTDAA